MTHRNSFRLLPLFGTTPVDSSAILDGDCAFVAAVTSGVSGALRLSANVFGDTVVQRIQLFIARMTESPFNNGTHGTMFADVPPVVPTALA